MPGPPDWGLLIGPGVRNPSAEEMKSRYEHRRAVYKAGGDSRPSTRAARSTPSRSPAARSPGSGWRTPTYLSAAVPQGAIDRAVLVPVMVEAGDKGGAPRFLPVPNKDQITSEQKNLPREFAAVLRPAGDHMALASYWGSKDYDRLKALPYGLEETIELGTLKPLVVPLLIALHWIHDHIVDQLRLGDRAADDPDQAGAPAADPPQHDVDAEDAGAQPQGAGGPRPLPAEAARQGRASRTSRRSAR